MTLSELLSKAEYYSLITDEEYKELKKQIQPCEDCISREEVLRHRHVVQNNDWIGCCVVRVDEITKLPSVTPSYNSVKTELEPCEDWKFYYKHGYAQAKRDLLCDDCISREEVIKHLENITMDTNPDNYDNKDKWYQANGFNLCKVGIEMYVKNLPPVTSKTKWIPCSERLPEEAGVYLVSMNRLGYPQREVDGFACGRWERFGNDVIAWCKIPESYKAESEDKEC